MSVHISTPFPGTAGGCRAGGIFGAGGAAESAGRPPVRPGHPDGGVAIAGEAGPAGLHRAEAARLAVVARGLSPCSGALEAVEGRAVGSVPILAEAQRPEVAPVVAPAKEPRRSKSGLPKWRFKRVAAYVDENLDKPVTLADMAAAAGLSRMHFAAQFKIATGARPHDYLLGRRIERAKAMMLASQEPLVEIALGVGFQTQAHFTTVFRRFVGDTPFQWRSAHRGRA